MTSAYSARIRAVQLDAPGGALAALAEFYCEQLGLDALERSSSHLVVQVGGTRLELRASAPSAVPFYHYAVLVPGNRFSESLDWLAERAELLPDLETGETTFDFDNWDALACYCHDPTGNIMELLAVKGLGETPDRTFSPTELLGVAEIGLVAPDTAAVASALSDNAHIHLWEGAVDEPGRLAFLGELGSTIILSPTGRGWLPTGRPAEVHPTAITYRSDREADFQPGDLPYRVRAVGS